MMNKTIDSSGGHSNNREITSRQYNRSYDGRAFNVIKNSRIKTDNYEQKFFKIRVNPKRITTLKTEINNLYHPDIYHKPEVRKKYFCQLVDSYINNKRVFEQQENKIDENNCDNMISRRNNNNNKTIQTSFDIGQVQDNNKNKKKRANTAGYGRKKQQINYKHLKIQNKLNQYHNQQQIDQLKNKSIANAELKIHHYLKNKTNNKLNVLNSYLRASNKNINIIKQKQQVLTSFSKQHKYDPAINSLTSSIISQDTPQKYSQIPLYSHSKLKQTKHKQQQNRKTKQKFSSRYKQTITINSSLQQSKSKLKPIKGGESPFSLSILRKTKNIQSKIDEQQKQKLQKEINLRLKFVNTEYGKVKWRIDYVHDYNIYKIFDISSIQQKFIADGRNSSKIKRNNLGNSLGRTVGHVIHLKIKKYSQDSIASNIKNTIEKVYNMGVSQLWRKIPRDPQIQKIDQCSLYYSQNKKPLRQQLFQFTIQQKSKQQQIPIYKIYATTLYHELFHNNCQYFKDIIRSIASDLTKMNGKLINNKISLDNLYRLQQKAIKIGDWGCSAVCRTIKVNGSQIVFRDLPILKYEQNIQDDGQNTWLLHPQNLPPQIIQYLIQGNYSKIWQNQSCPQIWSLGILIFQILTWIPVWMPYQTQVDHKFPKCGYLYDSFQKLSQIYALQCKIPAIVSRWLRDQKGSSMFKHIDPQILSLMKSMLQMNIKLRPKPGQILSRLQMY